eukprot:EG_transcript_4115
MGPALPRWFALLATFDAVGSCGAASWLIWRSPQWHAPFRRLLLDVCALAVARAAAGVAAASQGEVAQKDLPLAITLAALSLAGCVLVLYKVALNVQDTVHVQDGWWHLGVLVFSAAMTAAEAAVAGALLRGIPAHPGMRYAAVNSEDPDAPALNPADVASSSPTTAPAAPKKYKSTRLMALAVPEIQWLILGCIALLVRLPFSLSLPHFVSRVVSGLIRDDGHAVRWAIIHFVAAGTIDAILDFWCVFLFGYTQQRIIRRLRLDVFRSVLRQEVGFFDRTSTGTITSRLTADCAEMANDLTWVFRFTIEALVRIGGISGYMFYSDWRLGLVAYCLIPFIALINRVYGQWLKQNAVKVQTALADANAVAVESIGAMRTVFAFANEHLAYAHYNRCIQKNYHLNVRQIVAQSAYYMVVSTFLMNMVVQAALLIAGSHLVSRNSMKVEVLVAFMLYQAQLQEYFSHLLNSFTNLVKSMGAGAKVFELLDRTPVDLAGEGVVLPHVRGRIDFQRVRFTYPSSNAEVLSGLSFTVQPGKVVAIVGSSGAGKSTVFHLLENFYRPSSGSVKLDGVNVWQFSHRWLHTKVSIVGQEPVLFSGTIEENIMYGLGEDEWDSAEARRRVRVAAATANAHPFIEAFPQGYATEVGERGVQLSGGQRQRIAIARAIIQDPAVLLLDEATSALDSESEAEVQKGLEQAMQGRTVLVIAHRLSTVARAHCILVLDGGVLAEMGTHEELMGKPLGPGVSYRALVERQ